MTVMEHYKAWLEAKEHELRWLIGRRPFAAEFRYYLVFLLVAHRQDARALQECRQILGRNPNDCMARAWIHRLISRRFARCSRKKRARRATRFWNRSCSLYEGD